MRRTRDIKSARSGAQTTNRPMRSDELTPVLDANETIGRETDVSFIDEYIERVVAASAQLVLDQVDALLEHLECAIAASRLGVA